MRYFVVFSYFGKHYHGWQNQPNAITVQEVLEKTFSTLLRMPIALVGAGRTDAGVHAKEMCAHFDVEQPLENLESIVYKANAFLPEDISVATLFEVGKDAHARFDAVGRTYEYWVTQEKNPFYTEAAYYVKHPLNLDVMNAAANILLEYKDFECFSKTHTDVKTFLCDVRQAVWEQKEDRLVFTITADRFLRNMVRAIVGTLLAIGCGKLSVAEMHTIIKSKDRGQAGASVPAKGLYLTKIKYPNTIVE